MASRTPQLAQLHRRLVQRRNQINATLKSVAERRIGIESSTSSMDAAARERRRHWLDYLNFWCLREIDQIGSALKRMAIDQYGICLDCNAMIAPEWLQSFPESELCKTCQENRERAGWS